MFKPRVTLYMGSNAVFLVSLTVNFFTLSSHSAYFFVRPLHTHITQLADNSTNMRQYMSFAFDTS